MHRTFRYPLHPTPTQEATLQQWLGVCCDLYNAALQERRDAWRLQRRNVTKYDQQKSLTEVRANDSTIRLIPIALGTSVVSDGAKVPKARRLKISTSLIG